MRSCGDVEMIVLVREDLEISNIFCNFIGHWTFIPIIWSPEYICLCNCLMLDNKIQLTHISIKGTSLEMLYSEISL